MAHSSSFLPTRRSWLRRLQGWLQPAAAAPVAPAFSTRRSPLGGGSNPPYIGEIGIFAGNFAPLGWAFCDGSVLPISENEALFTLIGTTYGGDGQETFALPDLRGRAPMHFGAGAGLSTRVVGETAGVEQVTLTIQQIPAHTHTVPASFSPGVTASPTGAIPADGGNGSAQYTTGTGSLVRQPAQVLPPVGGSQPHNNMQPYLVVNYIISLFGVYPSPS
ncbi:phage tail protein [Hymenobacter koreensis]|uniref:Tail fiber protein n=1 Tax=Hymenobacter koreensis TaxID=1084523 RepID=A0ABP8JIB9_9BACT